MYLSGQQISYEEVWSRALDGGSKGLAHELNDATKRLKPRERTRAINRFFRIEYSEDSVDPALRKVRKRTSEAGKPAAGLAYIRALNREVGGLLMN